MKIKSIRYERCFNISGNQKERIGFIADITDKEKPESVLSKLYEMVIAANKKINQIREIELQLSYLEKDNLNSITCTENILKHAKSMLATFEKEKPVNNYKIERKKELIKRYEKELKDKLEEKNFLTNQYQQMINDFKKGVLS